MNTLLGKAKSVQSVSCWSPIIHNAYPEHPVMNLRPPAAHPHLVVPFHASRAEREGTSPISHMEIEGANLHYIRERERWGGLALKEGRTVNHASFLFLVAAPLANFELAMRVPKCHGCIPATARVMFGSTYTLLQNRSSCL